MISKKSQLIIFSGAGMSAESGLKTFRDNGGLWENHDVSKVATPQAWLSDPELVLRFYNERRKQLITAQPNKAHQLIAELESKYEVTVITQNIDDLHEKAGSTNVVHLHGELMKVQCEKNPMLIYEWTKPELNLGDLSEKGHQLRPHVVWFGEEVPKMVEAMNLVQAADCFIVIGTSLNVYPAASLLHFLPDHTSCYLIDPKAQEFEMNKKWTLINASAVGGMSLLTEQLLGDLNH
tara:strand:- start:32407 stop:33114 length:708 start_codon:yes stop_codon:yes gene_type:complete